MPRLQGSGIFATAVGLVAVLSTVPECKAYPFGKHAARGQPVYLVPQAQPAVQYAPVTQYAPVATAYAPTYNAPVATAYAPTYNAPVATAYAPTANAPTAPAMQVYYLNAQNAPAATANAPVGNAPSGSCNLPPDDQNEIIEQLRDMKNRELKDTPLSDKITELRQKALDLIADACGKDVEELSADDKALARRLAREALRDTAQAPNGQRYPVVGSAPGGYPAACYPGYAPYAWPTVIQPVVPVQLVTPVVPVHHRHHLFCPCGECKARRGY